MYYNREADRLSFTAWFWQRQGDKPWGADCRFPERRAVSIGVPEGPERAGAAV